MNWIRWFALMGAAASAQVILPDGRPVDTTSAAWQRIRATGQNPIAVLSLQGDISEAQRPAGAELPPPPAGSVASPASGVAATAVAAVATPAVAPSLPAPELAKRDSALARLVPDSVMIPNLNLRNTELRDVLSALGTQYGVNLVVDPSVTGPVTLNLRKIRLRDALKLLASENNLELEPLPGVLKVRRARPAPTPPPAEPLCKVSWSGGKMSLDLQGASIEKVARALADATQANVLVDKGLTGNVTLFLQKVTLAEGLSAIAENAGLHVRSQGGIHTFTSPPWKSNESGSMGGSGARIAVEADSLVTLEANQAALKDLIPTLGARMGVNLVVVGTLTGTATLRVSKVPLAQALDFLLSGTEFTWWMRDGAWFVGPVGTGGVTSTELIVLKHMKAEEVMDALPPNALRNAQLKLVKSHNAIMVLGARDAIDGIRRFAESIDFPVPQILIEALVVDINMDKVRSIGARAFLGKGGGGSNSRSIYPNFEQIFGQKHLSDELSAYPGLRDVVTLPKDFFLKVSAMEQERILEIRSRPQVATLNGSEATINIGQTQYFLLKSETNLPQTNGTSTQTTERFEKIQADVTLTVTPYVTGKGEITCDIVPDFSEPEGSFDSKTPPTINHRRLKSKVRLREGETIILGGLVKESNNKVYDQVPILGSIPVLGWLFKNRQTQKTRSQLLIFVTPHIYYGNDANVDPAKVLSDLDK
ncbi:MAG: hypothetical protein IPN71_13715 [Fibrobacteres bacterium]|nr:hypothetical protein [Fibrobacterota bacterium]